MKCPRCGQETVNISNKHICTACGIVISESVPRDQILEQLRSKVASQNAGIQASNSVSAVANMGQRNAPNTGTATIARPLQPHEAVAGKTLDQISREMLLQNNLPKQRTETSHTYDAPVEASPEMLPDTDGERVIPRVELTNTEPQVPKQVEQTVQAQPSQVTAEGQDIGTANVISPVYTNHSTVSGQAIYPSHQVNPIFIKILIMLVAILILSVGGYVVYSNFSGTGKFADNIIKYLGESFFK